MLSEKTCKKIVDGFIGGYRFVRIVLVILIGLTMILSGWVYGGYLISDSISSFIEECRETIVSRWVIFICIVKFLLWWVPGVFGSFFGGLLLRYGVR